MSCATLLSPIIAPHSCRIKTMAEINFLCVHKKLRNKRMAPVLIREITRRVNLENIFQALYTAGVKLPTPVASCRSVLRMGGACVGGAVMTGIIPARFELCVKSGEEHLFRYY